MSSCSPLANAVFARHSARVLADFETQEGAPAAGRALQTCSRKAPRWMRLLVLLSLLLLPVSAATAQTISGSVFFDPSADGARSATEIGAPGIVVSAFGVGDTLVSQTASCGLQAISIPADPPGIPAAINVAACAVADVGNYTLSGLAIASEYRLELTWNDGLLFDSALGSDASSSLLFASEGSTGVDFGVGYPEDYCQSNPRVIAGCYVFPPPFTAIPPWDSTRSDPLIVSWLYDDRFNNCYQWRDSPAC